MTGIAKVPGRGRKPKSTSRKEAAGNPGKRPLNKEEPDFGAVTGVDAPEWIIGHARAMWERVVPLLCGQKVLQMTDLHNVEIFCNAYGNWRKAQKEVAARGILVPGAQGGWIKNPALTAINETARQMATFGGILGLDPASRTRLIGGGNKKPDNPFGALLNG